MSFIQKEQGLVLCKPQSRDTSLPSGPSTTCVSSLPIVSVYTEIGRTHSTYRRIPVSGHRCCASCCATHSPSTSQHPSLLHSPPSPHPILLFASLCFSVSLLSPQNHFRVPVKATQVISGQSPCSSLPAQILAKLQVTFVQIPPGQSAPEPAWTSVLRES